VNQLTKSGKYEVMEGQPDDGAVFARSVAEPELFTIIFDRHYRSVYGYLSRRVGRANADDLAAETFARAFERRSSYAPAAALPWLLGIAVNLLAHHHRSEERQLRVLAAAGSMEAVRSVGTSSGRQSSRPAVRRQRCCVSRSSSSTAPSGVSGPLFSASIVVSARGSH
jgi:hypothetical protein